MKFYVVIILIVLIAACSTEESPSASETPSQIPTTTVDTGVRLQVETYYEPLRQLHTDLEGIWKTLAEGGNVQCGAEYASLEPESIPTNDELLVELRRATIELENALQLWQAECENPRPQIPSTIINQGVLMVRNAGDALQIVRESLEN